MAQNFDTIAPNFVLPGACFSDVIIFISWFRGFDPILGQKSIFSTMSHAINIVMHSCLHWVIIVIHSLCFGRMCTLFLQHLSHLCLEEFGSFIQRCQSALNCIKTNTHRLVQVRQYLLQTKQKHIISRDDEQTMCHLQLIWSNTDQIGKIKNNL